VVCIISVHIFTVYSVGTCYLLEYRPSYDVQQLLHCDRVRFDRMRRPYSIDDYITYYYVQRAITSFAALRIVIQTLVTQPRAAGQPTHSYTATLVYLK